MGRGGRGPASPTASSGLPSGNCAPGSPSRGDRGFACRLYRRRREAILPLLMKLSSHRGVAVGISSDRWKRERRSVDRCRPHQQHLARCGLGGARPPALIERRATAGIAAGVHANRLDAGRSQRVILGMKHELRTLGTTALRRILRSSSSTIWKSPAWASSKSSRSTSRRAAVLGQIARECAREVAATSEVTCPGSSSLAAPARPSRGWRAPARA